MMKNLFFASLFAVSLNAQSVTDYVSVSGNPTGIAFDSQGTLFIGTESDYGIKKYPIGGSLTTIISGMNGQPRQLSFDSSGNLWVAFQALGSIKKIAPLTGTSISYPATYPFGIAEDPVYKNIFFTEEGTGVLSRFTPSTASIANFSYNFLSPRGMVYDKNGNMYIATASGNEVLKLTPMGVATTIIQNIPNPTYLAIDNDDNLYVSNDYKGQIYKYNLSQTNLTASLFVDNLGYSNGLAVYNNELYCAIVSKNKVVRISLTLGTKEIQDVDKISVYPNPVENYMHVITTEKVESLALYSIDGKLILRNEKSNYFDMSKLQKGIYLVKIKTEKGTYSKKVIKK